MPGNEIRGGIGRAGAPGTRGQRKAPRADGEGTPLRYPEPREVRFPEDAKRWKELVRDLGNGCCDREFARLFAELQEYFLAYARRRLIVTDRAEEVVQDTWEEIIKKAKTMEYSGACKLKSFLTSVLDLNVIDINRRCTAPAAPAKQAVPAPDGPGPKVPAPIPAPQEPEKKGKKSPGASSWNRIIRAVLDSGSDIERLPGAPGRSPERLVIAAEAQRLIRECILHLRDESEEDAYLINLRLGASLSAPSVGRVHASGSGDMQSQLDRLASEMTYARMAQISLRRRDGEPTAADLTREKERIKKRFQRYRKLLVVYLESRGLQAEDLLDAGADEACQQVRRLPRSRGRHGR